MPSYSNIQRAKIFIKVVTLLLVITHFHQLTGKLADMVEKIKESLKKYANENEVALTNYEQIWSTGKNLPHYKYIALPLYKKLGGDKQPLFSVPATFFTMDVIFHQIPTHLYLFARANLRREPQQPQLYQFNRFTIAKSLLWASLSLPVAIHKQYNKPQ